MRLAEVVPGMAPGAPRRNALVLLLYLFFAFLLVGLLVRDVVAAGLPLAPE